MFERFTQSARHTVIAAQEVGLQTGVHQVDAMHLLAAILDAPGLRASLADSELGIKERVTSIHAEVRPSGLDEQALATIGIDLGEVIRRVEELFGEGALSKGSSEKRHIPLAPESKKPLELALREALRLRSKHISTVHLLLGLLSGQLCRAAGPGRSRRPRHVASAPRIRRACSQLGVAHGVPIQAFSRPTLLCPRLEELEHCAQ